MKNHIEQLVQWLQQQVKEAKVNGLLVGLSGGIDSSVVAYLIKQAMPDHSLGIIMPCKSHGQDEDDAQLVAESSGIDSVTVDLTDQHDLLFNGIKTQLKDKNEWNEEKERMADANLRARLRMSTLYTIAANYNYLVVGTDNAVEWYIGYFTKYGDGGVDLVPLLHYTKTEVRQIARELGVPEQIITKAPSAGLWEGQTDESEMGISYDTIDAFLNGEQVDEKDEQTIINMHQRTAHKRALPTSPPDFHHFTLE
ncbi:NAD(+) synthase [Tenuibacillus multivorans]|uniref:NH(3)-dependent NAD(+) synthetase n=1 Tax=Tenuibacillus multivorans TaxID=237069 RepID=A0A1G9ZK65_9BACI|nr:NAD(+) synthase [Tenuibacillus multivorans]GEL77466.1 NH(3)-dependent NAD(+) synthetase [Tenuibacillus multivorans]SDN21674.1 NAD+ synthase [Tenuibacillus multivorans]